MADLTYDPTEYASAEDYASSRARMDREFGMPSQAYKGKVGKAVNAEHHRLEKAMLDELGWCGKTPEDLSKRWDL